VSDDDSREAARSKLDDYAAALYADRDDVIGVGGWNLVVHGATNDEGTDTYLTESAPGQPWHASIGLIRYAQGFYEKDDQE
jgi:hypothetical protein